MSVKRGIWNSRSPGRTRMVARAVLARAGDDLSFAQLHRLLYLIEGHSLGLRGTALIHDTVLAGNAGPEWPALLDSAGREEVLQEENKPSFTKSEAHIVDLVYRKYGSLPLPELNQITSRQWPVAERAVGEVIVISEMRVHFEDLLAAGRIQRGERMPEGIALRYRSGTERAVSGDGHGHPRGATSDGRVIELPEIGLESFDYFGADDAGTGIEKYVLMALRLWEKGSEDFYPVALQTHQQIKRLRSEAGKVEDDQDRRELLHRLGRSSGTLAFLQSYGPEIQGSGPVRPSQVKGRKIGSITSGGLPSLGKR